MIFFCWPSTFPLGTTASSSCTEKQLEPATDAFCFTSCCFFCFLCKDERKQGCICKDWLLSLQQAAVIQKSSWNRWRMGCRWKPGSDVSLTIYNPIAMWVDIVDLSVLCCLYNGSSHFPNLLMFVLLYCGHWLFRPTLVAVYHLVLSVVFHISREESAVICARYFLISSNERICKSCQKWRNLIHTRSLFFMKTHKWLQKI